MYLQQEAIIRVGNGDTEPEGIGRGPRPGYPLSPILFLIYCENLMMIDAMEEGIVLYLRLFSNMGDKTRPFTISLCDTFMQHHIEIKVIVSMCRET